MVVFINLIGRGIAPELHKNIYQASIGKMKMRVNG
jgi:hypothetical protein